MKKLIVISLLLALAGCGDFDEAPGYDINGNPTGSTDSFVCYDSEDVFGDPVVVCDEV